jgi:O-antigen ligase
VASLSYTGGAIRRAVPPGGRLDRFALRWAVAAPLVFISIGNLTKRTELGELGRGATMLVLLGFAERFVRRLERDPPSALFSVTTWLFCAWLVHPLAQLVLGSPEQALLEAREVLYLAVWCAPLWLVSLAVPTTDELRTLVRWLDGLGLALAASVLAAYASHGTAWQLGEVYESGDGLRAFGPLGDMVSYCLLLFVGIELARRRWSRFALFLGAALLGQTRGVVAALVVGLLAAAVVPGRERRADGKTKRTARTIAVLLGGAGLAAWLFWTPAGQQTLERFGDGTTLFYEGELGGRLRSMRFAAERFVESPILGLGPGGYGEAVARENLGWSFDPAKPGAARGSEAIYAGSAENQLLHTAAETGLVGVVALVLWAAVALRTAARATAIPDPALKRFFQGVFLYCVMVLVGTQSAVYLLDKSGIVLLLCVVLGAAERGERAAAIAAHFGSGPRTAAAGRRT